MKLSSHRRTNNFFFFLYVVSDMSSQEPVWKHYFSVDIFKEGMLSARVASTFISLYSPLCSRKNHFPTSQRSNSEKANFLNQRYWVSKFYQFQILVTHTAMKCLINFNRQYWSQQPKRISLASLISTLLKDHCWWMFHGLLGSYSTSLSNLWNISRIF